VRLGKILAPMVPSDRSQAPEVRVFATREGALAVALEELRRTVQRGNEPLVCFATGATFTSMLQRLHAELVAGRVGTNAFHATHLDEYLGFAPTRPGGMVHELEQACPALATMRAAGRFLPVPCDGTRESMLLHEQRLRALGGVRLQFLGIGRNGHLAFNEPGTPFESGFHVTELAATTRQDAAPRFAPNPVPTHAVTSGLATVLGAERLVLCAFGKGKAPAVKAMLDGPVSVQCPASVLRRHPNVLVLLDREAASEWSGSQAAAVAP